jgi:RNA polymerase sigma-70 factor, ECF subfamily
VSLPVRCASLHEGRCGSFGDLRGSQARRRAFTPSMWSRRLVPYACYVIPCRRTVLRPRVACSGCNSGRFPDITGQVLNYFGSAPKDRRPPSGQSPAGATVAERAFDALFRSSYASVLRYALRRLPTRAAAEDIAAETFVVAWRRLNAMPADVLPWLLGIARRLILNEQRSDRRRARLIERLSAEPDDPAQASPEPSQEHRDVLEALGRLGERDQEVLRLTAWEGLTPNRAAAVLGCSRGAFAVRLHRARRRLVEQMSIGPPPSPERISAAARTASRRRDRDQKTR